MKTDRRWYHDGRYARECDAWRLDEGKPDLTEINAWWLHFCSVWGQIGRDLVWNEALAWGEKMANDARLIRERCEEIGRSMFKSY